MGSYFRVTSPAFSVEKVYETFQAAYDAANSLQVALGGSTPVQVLVGPVTAAQAGNLVLAANYNSNVSWVGQGPLISKLGTITGGFTLDFTAYNLTVGAITQNGKAVHLRGANCIYSSIQTEFTGGSGGDVIIDDGLITSFIFASGNVVSGGDRGGDITIGARCTVGNLSSGCSSSGGTPGRMGIIIVGNNSVAGSISGTCGATGGSITLGDNVTCTTISTVANTGPVVSSPITLGNNCRATTINASAISSPSGVGSTGGIITLGKGCIVTTITSNALAATATGGAVIIGEGSFCTSIDVRGTTIGGAVTLKPGSTVGSITWSSNPGILLSNGARITGQIDILNPASVCRNTVFSTAASNLDCIADISGNGAQFTDCLWIPHGTGNCLDAGSARTIIAYNGYSSKALAANVTLSAGSITVDANLLSP
jgi:hypothetical protein